MSWVVLPPDWNGHVGRILDGFFAEVRRRFPDYDAPLTVFGSAPIQLCLDDSFHGEIITPALREQAPPMQAGSIDRDQLLGALKPTRD